MPLGTNPSFSQVRAFFSGPANLSAYVRGGAYVPNIPANAAISTTAAGLALSQFSGADKQVAFSVNVTPAHFTGNYPNGALDAYFTAQVTGGVGPFHYSWFWSGDSFGVSLFNTTSPTVRVELNRMNHFFMGEAVVTVFDQGNGNVTSTASGHVAVQLGTPL